ncbi:unnamed protein product, partial [Discosporangium mesarthrocarpum]
PPPPPPPPPPEGIRYSDWTWTARASPWVGAAQERVSCVTFGCPPCISRNMRLPFVTSFVLGDDMIPRTSHQSLRRLKKRLLQVGGWMAG